MHKRKIKKKPIIILVLIIILIISALCLYKHFTSYQYKLTKIGYKTKEIKVLLKSDKKVLAKALEEYDDNLINLTKQKYFMWKNYKTYKNYINELHKKTNNINYNKVVTYVNTKRNYNVYTHTKSTDLKQNKAILVNKYYHLEEKYTPKDLVDMKTWYAYGNVKINKEVYEAFINMFNAAKKEKLTIIANSGYRSYQEQDKVYNQYKEIKGLNYADQYAARPGFSEHQTGLALDIITYKANGKDFDKTEEYKWLNKNAYKYGFILRYPKGKENITGYNYESWHYRYLGKDLAKKVYKSKLTYDEYYAFYKEGD